MAIVPDPPSAQIGEHQLKNWKLVSCVRQLLAQQLEGQPQPTSDPRRRLAAADYFCLILFGLFNPVVRSLRGLSRASRLPRVQEEVCRSPVSLGSFSEAQHVFDPQVLQRVLQQVAAKAAATFGQNEALARALPELVAHDSTLIKALPRMAWAVWMDKDNPGIRLHVDFEVFRQIPQDVAIEPAGRCERKVWKPRLQAGRFYEGDRYFGHDYNLMRLISRRSSWFVFRLQSNTDLEPGYTPVVGWLGAWSRRSHTHRSRCAGKNSTLLPREGPLTPLGSSVPSPCVAVESVQSACLSAAAGLLGDSRGRTGNKCGGLQPFGETSLVRRNAVDYRPRSRPSRLAGG